VPLLLEAQVLHSLAVAQISLSQPLVASSAAVRKG
jgi:hypothetical protein